ncbi:MAG: GNAT family N-acetyltransferase [Myxococcales bacterium]|nr:GNAT family N-acetyltransferase [Myxococcales bacterium]
MNDTRRWRLRPALPSDVDGIVAVHLAAFRDLVELRFDWDPEFQAHGTRTDVRQHLEQWQVLEVPDPHGTRTMGSLWCSRDDEGVCFVNRITVHPEVQGQGIGGQILADLQAREPVLRLSVWDVNRARPLYRRLGFVETHQEGYRVKMTWSRERPPRRGATVPESLDAVDAEWFAAVLGVPVTSARRVPPLAGFAGTSKVARFLLQGEGPTSVVLKLGHMPRVHSMYEREIATYRRLHQLPAPGLHAVLDEGQRVVMVLEDLTDRAPGHAIEGADEARGRSLLTEVAAWQRATWERDPEWPPRKVLPDGNSHQARARGGWERMDHDRFATDPETERAILALLDDLPAAMEALAGGPHALSHCDLHAENVVFDGERAIVLDWQNTTMAPAAIDLGGALVCVHPDVLATRGDSLLVHYLEALGQPWSPPEVGAQLRGAVAYQLGALAWLADEAPTTHRSPAVIQGHWIRLGSLARKFGRAG